MQGRAVVEYKSCGHALGEIMADPFNTSMAFLSLTVLLVLSLFGIQPRCI